MIIIVVILGIFYTIPNFFGESPAVQISSAKVSLKVDVSMLDQAQKSLQSAQIPYSTVQYEVGANPSVRIRFNDTDAQFRARLALEKSLNPDPADPQFIIAFNLLSNTPSWMQSMRALPMYLGLDLRGGVHFLMQVNMQGVLEKRLNGTVAQVRGILREANLRYDGLVSRVDKTVEVRFRDATVAAAALAKVLSQNNDLEGQAIATPEGTKVVFTLKAQALIASQADSVKQNIATLSKRVNELGVAEPVIQQQAADRIVVQLPGVQDVGRAKDIIGRTATLEVRMVDESIARGSELTASIPTDSELFKIGRDAPVVLKKEPIITGDYISNASATFDQNQNPAVSIDLNGEGGRKMRDATRDKVGKSMSIVLFEKGRGEVLTVATIRDVLGSRFQITGMGSAGASNDLALLLRAGSLAAPMEIIEERTVGPQLGVENIKKGFNSTLYGFIAVAVFMILYYLLFGAFSVLALAVNLLLLVGVLSLLQATLTLPGFAAMALVLGMAIDSNVLINERVREELRAGLSPHAAITAGFERAWATILDSNITTLIAGLALLTFGSGAVRGFAVVHTIGILTSIFSSVLVSRGLVNFWYGDQKKLTKISIGQVWRPSAK